MARVVASFIGRGRLSEEPSGRRYVPTVYRFPDGAQEESSFFGVALLRWLEGKGERPQRWLVMGTGGSMWDALYEVLPPEGQERLLEEEEELWEEVFDAKERGEADQRLVSRWEAAIRRLLSPSLDLRLRVVGAADTKGSQLRMWEELTKALDEGDVLILDITHGFRHQPVLAAFMAVLLRWLKGIGAIEIYYGAFEMGEGEVCPVLRMDLCEFLFEASEAMAVFGTTGNFAPLAGLLPLADETKEKVGRVAFADEINKQERAAAREVLRAIEGMEADPLHRAIAESLREPLRWAEQEGLHRRMARKARFALEHGQYLRAVVLLYEAFFVAARRALRHDGDLCSPEVRRLLREGVLREHLSGEEFQIFSTFEALRNVIVHVGRPRGAKVQRAIGSPQTLEALFREAEGAFEALLKRLGLE